MPSLTKVLPVQMNQWCR